MANSGRVLSVNIARASAMTIRGQRVMTAIAKRPVEGAQAVRTLAIVGDEQADLSVHGGPSRAVYAYPSEHYAFWQTVRAQADVAPWSETLPPGSLGENLTTAGVVETDLFVGDVLRFAGCALAVGAPRLPCFKFNAAMGFRHAAKLMTESAWCGWYLSVREPGTIAAGDVFEIEPGPREVGIWELFRARTGKKAH
ncbi:MAG TPA: MOSC domain-containing protein [Caldimonas sp.]|jgi:MOSC domain-containing protein YiiM|nr:MOSC domain-containing protein [Caldimonas sp.]HEX4233499.1 MOSC domain-containing protein [Caldimonas sp.]